jgi:hypothetical protein
LFPLRFDIDPGHLTSLLVFGAAAPHAATSSQGLNISPRTLVQDCSPCRRSLIDQQPLRARRGIQRLQSSSVMSAIKCVLSLNADGIVRQRQ